MFGFGRDPKQQEEEIPSPASAPEGAIISPDTYRENRTPPRQSRTKKWPILDASGPPNFARISWRFTVTGLVEQSVEWTKEEFQALPRVQVFADMHCVTRWSRLGNLWEGVSTQEVVKHLQIKPNAKYVLVYGYDYGWTTNMPLEEFLRDDCLFADKHDGEEIDLEHGGPIRLVIPRLYAWKSAKWVRGIEFMEEDRAGFWERGGYHMFGDPWKEQRFREEW
jgi:DMSO/TMAO reductase YedYZ molybdopterin-dependent catalytic subunit